MSHTSLYMVRGQEICCDAPVAHTHASVVLYQEGRAHFWMGSPWRINPGEILLVPDGALHHRLDRDEIRWLGLAICMPCLPKERWGEALRGLFDRVSRGGCPILRPAATEVLGVAELMAALEVELRRSSPDSALAVDGLLGLLTARLLRAEPAHAALPDAAMPLVVDALQWIAAHAHEAISLTDVAAALGRAPTYLAARVKEETGHPVGYWIENARMALARDRLLHSDDSIELIAERIGYASASHFHRTFRRAHAMTPGAWRKRHRSSSEAGSSRI